MRSIALIWLIAGTIVAKEIVQVKYANKTDIYKFKQVHSTGYTVAGMVWSIHKKGSALKIGCEIESGLKLNFGEIYETAQAQFICEESGDQILLRPIACMLDNEPLRVGHLKRSGKFFYRCSHKESHSIGLDIVGCVNPATEKLVPIGAYFRSKDFQFQCQTDGQKVFIRGSACYIRSGKIIPIGEKYKLDLYYYQCTRKGERGIKTKVIGCVDGQGAMVHPRDKFRSGSILYMCNETEEGLEHEPIGCVVEVHRDGKHGKKLNEYLFGQRWQESYKENLAYTMECTENDEEVGPAIVECIAVTDSGNIALKVGCGRAYDQKTVFICKAGEDGAVMAKLKSVTKGKTHKYYIDMYEVQEC